MFLNKNKKKFAPINRRYIRQQKLKRIAIFLTVLVFAEGAFLLRQEGKNLWEKLDIAHRFDWKVKQITVAAPTDYIKREILNIIKDKQITEGTHFSTADVKELENTLKENIKEAKTINVKRNFFTKELSVSCEKFMPFAKIITPQDSFFVTEDGYIFQDLEEEQKKGFLNISLNAKIESEKLPTELVQFIKEIKNTSLRKTDFLNIDVEGQSAQFQTDFGPVKLGSFEDVKQQLSVLTEILQVAKNKKFTVPYFVDFTYFGKGKVYLKQNYKDL